MTNHPHGQSPVAEGDVVAHLGRLLAEMLELEPELIDPDLPLSAYGIDSMTSTRLTEVLERRYEVSLRPGLLFDRPSIAEVAQEVMALLAPAPGTAAG
ncbi:acyl carrier protein [Streptomyces parvus]|uniref:acyl carrier protein n=1 Tax=Streptomyces TaxID=1883 RepID=UPI0005175900|nr:MULTISPECIES: acyl carrier protein [unclassified Streptomyces]PVC99842.1 acyl carrier protein [Streptomyces sp. CS147]